MVLGECCKRVVQRGSHLKVPLHPSQDPSSHCFLSCFKKETLISWSSLSLAYSTDSFKRMIFNNFDVERSILNPVKSTLSQAFFPAMEDSGFAGNLRFFLEFWVNS